VAVTVLALSTLLASALPLPIVGFRELQLISYMSSERAHLNGIATSAVMSYLGWLASNAGSTPALTTPVSGRSRAKSGRGGSNSSYGMTPTNRSDLQVKPPDQSRVPKGVPRNVANKVTWDVVKIDGTLGSGTSVTEINFSATLSTHPQASSWSALFDQWTIPQLSVTFRCVLPPGTTTVPPDLYTAIDFDSGANLGSIAAIEDYATCAIIQMEPGKTLTRSCKPCCKPQLGATASSGVGRYWVDSAVPTIPFNGIRTIVGTSPSTFTTVLHYTITIWYAFRNQI